MTLGTHEIQGRDRCVREGRGGEGVARGGNQTGNTGHTGGEVQVQYKVT